MYQTYGPVQNLSKAVPVGRRISGAVFDGYRNNSTVRGGEDDGQGCLRHLPQ